MVSFGVIVNTVNEPFRQNNVDAIDLKIKRRNVFVDTSALLQIARMAWANPDPRHCQGGHLSHFDSIPIP